METKGDMKYYSQYRIHDLFELQESLLGLSKSNRWVKLADRLPWAKIEKEYNKRLRNSHCGAGNKPARMVVGALIVKHVENLSNDRHAEEKRRALCERNEIEATFGTSKRVYRANDIRAKLDNTADTWIGACFFAKNRLGNPQKESSQHHRQPRGSFSLVTSQLGQDKLANPKYYVFIDVISLDYNQNGNAHRIRLPLCCHIKQQVWHIVQILHHYEDTQLASY